MSGKRINEYNIPTINIRYNHLKQAETDLTPAEHFNPNLEVFSRFPPSSLIPSIEKASEYDQRLILNYVFYKFKLDPGENIANKLISLNKPYTTSIHNKRRDFNLRNFFQLDCIYGADCVYWGSWRTHTSLDIPLHFFISGQSILFFRGPYDLTKLKRGEFKYENVKQDLETRQKEALVLDKLFYHYQIEDLCGLVCASFEVNNINDLIRLTDRDIEDFFDYVEKYIGKKAKEPDNDFYCDPMYYDCILSDKTKEDFIRMMNNIRSGNMFGVSM